jgi:hypothetical protein
LDQAIDLMFYKRARAMKRMIFLAFAGATAACVTVSMPFTAGGADEEGSPIYGVKIPAGFREWSLINVAHEAADLNDFRVVLGNPIAIKAFQDGTLPFPDGTGSRRFRQRIENSEIGGCPPIRRSQATASALQHTDATFVALGSFASFPRPRGVRSTPNSGRIAASRQTDAQGR